MDNEIITTVRGNVATDPDHQVSESGVPRTKFRIASTRRRWDKEIGQYVDSGTSWINVTCWRGLAVNTAVSLRKGQPVVIQGRLSVRDWEDGERRGTSVDLDAVCVGHDLTRGTATFGRAQAMAPDGPSTDSPPPVERVPGVGEVDLDTGELLDGQAVPAA